MASILNEDKVKHIEKEFDKVFYSLVDDLVCHLPPDTLDSKKWFKRVLEYNVPHGKRNRGLSVVFSYQCLANGNTTEEDLKIASILGWCIELLQAFFLVADDMMDSSSSRRGQPCWYMIKDVGLKAINDSLYIESALYFLLKKHLRHKHYYTDIVDLFHETTLNTIIGQQLDTSAKDADIEGFTLERYNATIKYKTAYYSFHLPMACALYMAGINDPKIHEEAKTILLKIGEFFQIQDDYLDAFGDPNVTGKIGTDIEENKCSWLIMQALSRCDENQESVLKNIYGHKDSEKVAQVKQIYLDLGLKEAYDEYESQSHEELLELIEQISPELPKEMFLLLLAKIYKRCK